MEAAYLSHLESNLFLDILTAAAIEKRKMNESSSCETAWCVCVFFAKGLLAKKIDEFTIKFN